MKAFITAVLIFFASTLVCLLTTVSRHKAVGMEAARAYVSTVYLELAALYLVGSVVVWCIAKF